MTTEQILDFILRIDNFWIYAVIFFFAYIENLFPPSPSDIIVIFCASLIGLGKTEFMLTFLSATFGSTLGFITMYFIGDKFGDEVLEKGKIKFISPESVRKVEKLFSKYGDFLIVINRFLAGTRAVVAFFAGMGEMNLKRAIILSFISASMWYGILVFAGNLLGKNWKVIGDLLSTYSTVITTIVVLLIILFIIRAYFKTGRKKF
jgi:membrane protein DedA with SNARE-associated domain